MKLDQKSSIQLDFSFEICFPLISEPGEAKATGIRTDSNWSLFLGWTRALVVMMLYYTCTSHFLALYVHALLAA